MAIEVSRIKVGDVLYSTGTEQAGNTTMRRKWCRRLVVKEIGEVENDNPNRPSMWWCVVSGLVERSRARPTRRYRQEASRWRRSAPKWSIYAEQGGE